MKPADNLHGKAFSIAAADTKYLRVMRVPVGEATLLSNGQRQSSTG